MIALRAVTRELRRINSYPTKMYKIPKIGDVYKNKYTVTQNITKIPKEESTDDAINAGVGMGKMIYNTNTIISIISRGEDLLKEFTIAIISYNYIFMYKES
jgi:hypothetical protein